MKKISAKNSMRPFSSILVDGPERAAARAMLYPVGFTEADFKKPIIGIASTWSNVTPCNMHIDKLALEAEKGANAGDFFCIRRGVLRKNAAGARRRNAKLDRNQKFNRCVKRNCNEKSPFQRGKFWIVTEDKRRKSP